LGNVEFRQSLGEIVEERLPFLAGDVEMSMGIGHGPAGVTLGPAGGLADLLGHEVLEPRRGNLVVSLVDLQVCIQSRIVHDPIDEGINHGGDGVDPAKLFVE
jgi:hypothetical protein